MEYMCRGLNPVRPVHRQLALSALMSRCSTVINLTLGPSWPVPDQTLFSPVFRRLFPVGRHYVWDVFWWSTASFLCKCVQFLNFNVVYCLSCVYAFNNVAFLILHYTSNSIHYLLCYLLPSFNRLVKKFPGVRKPIFLSLCLKHPAIGSYTMPV
jgi:hypothetical protein